MKKLAALFVLLSTVAIWGGQRAVGAKLEADLHARRAALDERDALRRERDRLRQLEPVSAMWQELRQTGAERERLQTALAARERDLASSIARGTWTPFGQWQNRGQSSPHHAIETTLWAAANGETSSLIGLLHLPPATRVKVKATLARLSPEARIRYGSAEQLIAEFTAKTIPLGQAQLGWLRQTGPDEATACVLLNQADPQAPSSLNATYLTLQRANGAWRLVVPVAAIDRIDRELSGSPPP